MSIAKACYTKINKKASAQYYCRTTVDLEKGKVLLRERQTAEKSSEFPSVHMFYLLIGKVVSKGDISCVTKL